VTPPKPRVLAVIPARLASTRLPRKVLRDVAGKPLLAWVYAAAAACKALDQVVIATDSEEVLNLCRRSGWPALMTSPDLPSGTDRLFAVSREIPADIYVNVQGDEPLLRPEHIDALLAPFTQPHVDVTTLRIRCSRQDVLNPNVVKVVTARDSRALYFSRSPIPFDRDGTGKANHWKHMGLYAYRHQALEKFAALRPGELEQTERLEQLRLLENGLTIHVAETTFDTVGVDTEEDLRRVEPLLRKRSS
jgi:3-deoxy-manno-octulosonate cytidylyltransferase (CMP-KDO synthetase)